MLTYGLQVTISVMFFGRIQLDSLLLSALLAAQVLLLIWKVRLRGIPYPPYPLYPIPKGPHVVFFDATTCTSL